MAADKNKALTDIMDRTRAMMAGNPMMEPKLEQFWQAQKTIFEETHAFSMAWFERRQEASKTALETMRRVNGADGADPGAMMRAVIDWQQGSFQRLNKDMQDWVALCTRCAGPITEAEVKAGKETVEEAAKQGKATTKTSDSTPV